MRKPPIEFTKISKRDMPGKVLLVHLNVSIPPDQLQEFGRNLKATSGASNVIVIPKGIRVDALTPFAARKQIRSLLKAVDKELKYS